MSTRHTFPASRVAAATGATPLRWEAVTGSGYGTNTTRWRVELDDGRRGFVKAALDELASDWLRREHHVYQAIAGSFMPALLGWHDADGATALVIEDLADAHWPPPWPPHAIEAVLAAVDEVHRTPPPPGLQHLQDLREGLDGWPKIALDPEPFLGLGLCSREWLEAALPELSSASASCELGGAAFLHLDVRSDNLCLREGNALLVDWNWASVGNPLIDVVAWLPSLRLEGGPEPWTLVPDSGGLAALMAGFFSAYAGLPPPATAPRVRDFQRRQGAVALPWAARELGLPAPTPGLHSPS